MLVIFGESEALRFLIMWPERLNTLSEGAYEPGTPTKYYTLLDVYYSYTITIVYYVSIINYGIKFTLLLNSSGITGIGILIPVALLTGIPGIPGNTVSALTWQCSTKPYDMHWIIH